MPLVLDCSVTLAWLLPDEKNAVVDALMDGLARDAVLVPPVWPLEVGNVLLVAMRRGRISSEDRGRMLKDLRALPIEIDGTASNQALGGTLEIADRYGLTSYDASYLELALRRSLPLATLDAALRNACVSLGVPSLP